MHLVALALHLLCPVWHFFLKAFTFKGRMGTHYSKNQILLQKLKIHFLGNLSTKSSFKLGSKFKFNTSHESWIFGQNIEVWNSVHRWNKNIFSFLLSFLIFSSFVKVNLRLIKTQRLSSVYHLDNVEILFLQLYLQRASNYRNKSLHVSRNLTKGKFPHSSLDRSHSHSFGLTIE